jgi:hypothetical protein
MRPHILPQPGIQEFPGASRVPESGTRLGLRCAGPIRLTAGRVAGIFPAQGTGARPTIRAIIRSE